MYDQFSDKYNILRYFSVVEIEIVRAHERFLGGSLSRFYEESVTSFQIGGYRDEECRVRGMMIVLCHDGIRGETLVAITMPSFRQSSGVAS